MQRLLWWMRVSISPMKALLWKSCTKMLGQDLMIGLKAGPEIDEIRLVWLIQCLIWPISRAIWWVRRFRFLEALNHRLKGGRPLMMQEVVHHIFKVLSATISLLWCLQSHQFKNPNCLRFFQTDLWVKAAITPWNWRETRWHGNGIEPSIQLRPCQMIWSQIDQAWLT